VSKMPANSRFAVLKIAFDDTVFTNNTKMMYKSHIDKHNKQILSDPYPNSGFDLLVMENMVFDTQFKTVFINHGIKTEMLYYDPVLKTYEPSAFIMTPRSSISKTPLMMANHVGIIDSGYRGNLLAAVRYLPDGSNMYTLEEKTRLFQVCHPLLCPIYVMATDDSDLSTTTRGAGGFGSTGV